MKLILHVAKFGNKVFIKGSPKFTNNVINIIANNPKYDNIQLSNQEHQKQQLDKTTNLLENKTIIKRKKFMGIF